MKTACTLIGLMACLLTACGGGSSSTGGGNSPTSNAITSMSQLQPGTTMTWQTNSSTDLSIHVQRFDGQAAAAASVRVFRLNWFSPQDGARLEEPVPVALLDSGVVDSSGNLTLSLRLPADIDEVMVVVSEGDSVVKHVVDLTQSSRTVDIRFSR